MEAPDKWLKVTEAYDILTDEKLFADWLDYGSPEAGNIQKRIGKDMPAWLYDPNYQVYMWGLMFFLIVIFPQLFMLTNRYIDYIQTEGIKKITVDDKSKIAMLKKL